MPRKKEKEQTPKNLDISLLNNDIQALDIYLTDIREHTKNANLEELNNYHESIIKINTGYLEIL